MTMTIEELKDYISHNVDEVDVLELLNISSEDLVEAFHEVVEDKFDKLIADLELEQDDDYENE